MKTFEYKGYDHNGRPRKGLIEAMPIEMKPTFTETEVPWIILAATSRPSSSVPSQWSAVGGEKKSSVCSTVLGEMGAWLNGPDHTRNSDLG